VTEEDLLRHLDVTLERNARAFEDLQVVIRDSATRQERALRVVERRLDAGTAQIRANTEATRAHTEAIWRMLDRWGEGPTPAS
jgi:hypothetical protein